LRSASLEAKYYKKIRNRMLLPNSRPQAAHQGRRPLIRPVA
jgi:hypothetical protein